MDIEHMLHRGRVSRCYDFWKAICRERNVLKHKGGISILFLMTSRNKQILPSNCIFQGKKDSLYVKLWLIWLRLDALSNSGNQSGMGDVVTYFYGQSAMDLFE